jgi:hypothetical protein
MTSSSAFRKTLQASTIAATGVGFLFTPLAFPIALASLAGLAVTSTSRQHKYDRADRHRENEILKTDLSRRLVNTKHALKLEEINARKILIMNPKTGVHPSGWAKAFRAEGILEYCEAELTAANAWLQQQYNYVTAEAVEGGEEFTPSRPTRLPKISADISDLPPDGAKLIQCKDLNDVNKYPVVMLIAPPGSGKSATMGAIMQQLSGWKAIASPKPLNDKMQGMFDLVYGCDPETGRWLNWGNLTDTDCADHRDLSFQLHKAKKQGKQIGSMLDFLWGCRRESMNRMQGTTENKVFWRCFFDEASYTYTSGYNDPQDAKGAAEKATQTFISGINKDAFQNFRGQKVQYFLGAQVETVDSIGLNGFNGAKKEAWFLFPGMKAIAAAEKHGKNQLAQWLKRRVKAGLGVALLIKEGVFFEVLDLPPIAELSALVEGVDMVLQTPVNFAQVEANEKDKEVISQTEKTFNTIEQKADSAEGETEDAPKAKNAGSNGWRNASKERDRFGFSEFYKLYIKSDEWEAKRQQRLKIDGRQCAVCSAKTGLQVHHKDYSRLGDEPMEHLITLCKVHHDLTHNLNKGLHP